MRLALLLLVALAVVGCDSARDDGPSWTLAGAVATFDFAPGPDSLRIFVADTNGGGEHRAAEAQAPAVRMRVLDSPGWRRTDRYVEWQEVPPPGAAWADYDVDAHFPLDDGDVELVEDGLAVVVDVDCYGSGFGGGPHGTLTYLRVPLQSRTIGEYANCQRSASAVPYTYAATGPETVTVPAGTFDAIRMERPGGSTTTVEWWSWEAGLVRLDVLNEAGVLKGRFVRSAGQ